MQFRLPLLCRVVSVVSFLFVLIVFAPVQAQQPVWNLDGAAFSATAAELAKAAAAVTAEKFTDATVLFERERYTVDAAGRVTYRHYLVYRIETQAGVDGWSEVSVRWEPWHQDRPEIRARVLQPDGKATELDQKTLTDGPANEDEDDTYTDARMRKGPLPALAVGALVEEEIVLADKTPFFAAGSVYRDVFSRNVPVIREQLIVETPVGSLLEYRVHLLPQVKIEDKNEGGVRRIVFDQQYLPLHTDGDIQLATHQFLEPMVEFATGASWAAVARGYSQMAEPQIDPARVKALVPAAGGDQMETIRRIVARLHKEVRYTGVEFGQAAIQPQTGTEVLKRHFGDCKDKAALLVAMLRAAGIPAHMALLDVGPGLDVTADLPGMNEFDHAIVFVPAAEAGGQPLWIDATAEYAEVATLPSMDQDRQALVIAEGTTALTKTPVLKPEENLLTELREFRLANYGLAHVTETSRTHGPVDLDYRADFGSTETRQKRTNLETYAKNYYLAKALTNVERGDGKDLTKPFVLKLDMAEAKRGNTLVDDAAVAIPQTSIFERLPAWFRTDPKTEGEKLTPQQEEDRKRAVAARTSEYDVVPFATAWRYTITPPAGFVLRALPKDAQVQMGPALLTEHFETGADGVVKAVFHFSTGKPRYTAEEALALRDAVVAAYKQDMILILFDQKGAKLIAAGKIREALAADRELIASHPKDAVQHAQMAYALLKASMGTRARGEAEQATKLDPKSAIAFRTLGWVCQHDAIGVLRVHGFDRDCAETAFRKAVALDADDLNMAMDLAILEEFDPKGERYAADAHLADAIRDYRAMQKKDKATGDQYEDNLLFDLLRSHQYKELLDELAKLPSSGLRNGLGIAAMVAQVGGAKGVTAGLEKADRVAGGAETRGEALNNAGGQLMQLRMYPEAAEILAASVVGQSNSAAVAQQISILRKLAPWKGVEFPASDPRAVVERLIAAMTMGEFDAKVADEVLSRHAYGSEREWKLNLRRAEESRGALRLTAARAGVPVQVLIDVTLGNMKCSSEGDDAKGYKVSVQMLGSAAQKFFVSKDDGAYRIVTDGVSSSETGNEALYLLDAGRVEEAASLLDWLRDKVHRGGGDDPLAGPLFPRFWTAGAAHDPAAMRMAAASLVAYTPAVKPLIPAIRTALDGASSADQRASLQLLLAQAEQMAEDGAAMKPLAGELLKNYPDSYVAIALAGEADYLQKDFKAWDALLDGQIAKHPEDEQLLRQKANKAGYEGDYVQARAALQKVIDLGKGTASDYNLLAWSALYDGKVDAETAKAAQQASMLTQNANFSVLHTLACIYAAEGKTVEASDLLRKAMTAGQLIEPNESVWFGYALLYEQYGANEAAIEAYRKMEKPEGILSAFDTWQLAQARLKALGQ